MVDKGELEKQKLQAEIKEIELKIESEIKSTKWNRAKILTTILLTYTSIAIGIITIWTKSETFLRQKEKEQDFILNKEMLILVGQLNESDVHAQENAAILLSFFKKDAIPILLMNLERSKNPKATIESLRLIKENKKIKPQEVLDLLIGSARKIFGISEVANDKDLLAFSNYIIALGELGRKKEKDVEELLNNLKKRVEEKKLTLSDDYAYIIKKNIQESVEKLRKNSINHNFKE